GSIRYASLRALGSRIGRIDQHGNSSGLRHQIVQQLQSFRLQLTRKKIDPRQISAWPGEAGDKTELDRVFADTKDDRDRRGCSFAHLSSVIARGRGENGHATTPDVSHNRRKAMELVLQPVVLSP